MSVITQVMGQAERERPNGEGYHIQIITSDGASYTGAPHTPAGGVVRIDTHSVSGTVMDPVKPVFLAEAHIIAACVVD